MLYTCYTHAPIYMPLPGRIIDQIAGIFSDLIAWAKKIAPLDKVSDLGANTGPSLFSPPPYPLLNPGCSEGPMFAPCSPPELLVRGFGHAWLQDRRHVHIHTRYSHQTQIEHLAKAPSGNLTALNALYPPMGLHSTPSRSSFPSLLAAPVH